MIHLEIQVIHLEIQVIHLEIQVIHLDIQVIHLEIQVIHLHSASFFLKKFLAAVCCRDLRKKRRISTGQESKARNPGKSRYTVSWLCLEFVSFVRVCRITTMNAENVINNNSNNNNSLSTKEKTVMIITRITITLIVIHQK